MLQSVSKSFTSALVGIAIDQGKFKGVDEKVLDFFPEYIDKRMDPRERTYYWQGCDSLPAGKSTDIDGSALCEDFISITPIKCDQTDYQVLENLKGWKLAARLKKEKLSQK